MEGSARPIKGAAGAAWALVPDAGVALLAADMGVQHGLIWGLGIAAPLVLALAAQLRLYRRAAAASASQIKLGAAMVLAAPALLVLGPRPHLMTGILVGAIGLCKLIRESRLYAASKRELAAQGLRRRPRARVVLASAAVLIGALVVCVVLLSRGEREAGPAAWLCAYAAFSAVFELAA